MVSEILSYTLFVIATISVAISLFVFLYHLVLMLVAFWSKPTTETLTTDRVRRFAIVIPAHNEVGTIQIALDSCATLDYPSDAYEVFVVADNCTDATADCARRYGVHVVERHDTEKRGKGYALQFAFDEVLQRPFDAVVVLDADCRLQANALKIANDSFAEGKTILQFSYETSNYDASSTSLLLGVANALENHYYYAPKSRLGMFVVLRGTGMVFDVAILQRYPWTSFSVVEDSEYSYKLVRAGYRIWFVDNVNVTSEFPENRSQLDTQRRRWFGGGVELAASQSWNLLKTGLTALDWRLVDAAINSWIVARPLIILQLSVSIVAAIIYCLVASDQTLASVFLVSLVAVIAGYLTYVAVGLLCVGLSAHRLSLLLKTPWFVAYYLCISANALARGASKEWVSTPRQAKTSDVQPRASR